MKVLHKSVVSSCEYFVEGEFALIKYKGTIEEKFIYDCISVKTENKGIRNSKFLLLDLRDAEFDVSRTAIAQISELIKKNLGLKTSLAIIVDRPRETAIAFLLRQNLFLNDVNVFASPQSALSTFEPRTTKNLYKSKIFSLLCN